MTRIALRNALSDGQVERWKGCPEKAVKNYCDAAPFEVSAQCHRFVFYPAGVDRLAALKQHIERAQHTLDVYFYLFQDDEAGAVVRDALIAAAERGVSVSLIVDAFGSSASHGFFAPLVAAGANFREFSPKWNVRYLIRNHQKFVIADGEWVMTGGFNISDHYFMPPEENGWCDLGVAIEGPVVIQFARWFAQLQDWIENGEGKFRGLRDLVSQWDAGAGPEGASPESDAPVQLLLGGPLLRRAHWAWSFRQDLMRARRLDTVSAYFSPPLTIRRLMARVARRGRVRLITAGKSDIAATIDVARLLYRKLLRCGARIFEFQPCKLHMKLLIVDDIAYFGSANLDKRSFRVNVELMVRVEDAELARALREFVDHMEQASDEMTPEKYARQATWWKRLVWRFKYMIAFVDYRLSRGLNE
ncbi:MAG: phosphatidylserine/phosphatidylglycerophosphate/cardiolipin synthase family protein [Pseudomonadota bacterium]